MQSTLSDAGCPGGPVLGCPRRHIVSFISSTVQTTIGHRSRSTRVGQDTLFLTRIQRHAAAPPNRGAPAEGRADPSPGPVRCAPLSAVKNHVRPEAGPKPRQPSGTRGGSLSPGPCDREAGGEHDGACCDAGPIRAAKPLGSTLSQRRVFSFPLRGAACPSRSTPSLPPCLRPRASIIRLPACPSSGSSALQPDARNTFPVLLEASSARPCVHGCAKGNMVGRAGLSSIRMHRVWQVLPGQRRRLSQPRRHHTVRLYDSRWCGCDAAATTCPADPDAMRARRMSEHLGVSAAEFSERYGQKEVEGWVQLRDRTDGETQGEHPTPRAAGVCSPSRAARDRADRRVLAQTGSAAASSSAQTASPAPSTRRGPCSAGRTPSFRACSAPPRRGTPRWWPATPRPRRARRAGSARGPPTPAAARAWQRSSSPAPRAAAIRAAPPARGPRGRAGRRPGAHANI